MLSSEHEGRNAAGVVNLNGGADAARYMEEKLSGPVRSGIEAVLHDKPRDPLRYLAEALRDLQQKQQQEQQQKASPTIVPSQRAQRKMREAAGAFNAAIGHRNVPSPQPESPEPSTATATTAAPPLSLTLRNGRSYKVLPLSTDFSRANARHGVAAAPASFPSVLYREAASLFEVGSCLRRLEQFAPQAPLLLIVESPAATSNVFFYEGLPYACTTGQGQPVEVSQTDVTDDIRDALSRHGGTVQNFSEALRSTVADAAPATRVVVVPALQTSFLDAFDRISCALDEAYTESWQRAQAESEPTSAGPRAAALLPSVLLVSYKADTARLTHARVLAAYGPFYEAAQRLALQSLRRGQLERQRKFTFGFAMEYWAQVQRRRETSNGSVASAKTAAGTSTDTAALRRDAAEDGSAPATIEAAAGEQDTSPEGSHVFSAAKDMAKAKRVAARSVKRGLPAYDAEQQAEDDVFLVVIRRLEHAAATLIQSCFRGHRARVRCRNERRARAATPLPAPKESTTSATVHHSSSSSSTVFGVEAVQPLLQASLRRLVEEGKALGDIWDELPASPPPDSRRCWIYRPVQRTVKANTAAAHEAALSAVGTKESAKAETSRVREEWVQEELLIPPLRATQPRVHLNVAQRLLDYLAVAQCTILRDTVQLFADTPGMSALQRRAYDHVKSICLTLFFVAYGELRQRDRGSVPPTFSQYMCVHHAPVLTWCQFPHECSLLLRAVGDAGEGEGEDVARRAAGAFVQAKLSAHETFLVARSEPKPNAPPRTEGGVGGAGDPSTASAVLVQLSSNVLLSTQPLLSQTEWAREVAGVAAARVAGAKHKAEEKLRDKATCVVHWWSLAPVPMCCVADTPIAAVGRWDAQLLDAAPAYDCFVPRVRSVAADALYEEVVDAALANPATATALASATAASAAKCGTTAAVSVVHRWVRGDLADAEDLALAAHAQAVMATEGYMECYRTSQRRRGTSFIDLAPSAAFTRYVGAGAVTASSPAAPSPAEDSVRVDAEEGSFLGGETPSARRRSVERRGGWGRVMEAVALEAAASRRNSPRHSSISLSPRTSVSASGWSRHVSPHVSTSLVASVSPTDSQEEGHVCEEKQPAAARREEGEAHAPATHKKNVRAAYTVSEVASEVAAGSPAITLHHRRRALRFLAGCEGAVQLDAFVDAIVASLEGSTKGPSPCLVLALDVSSQAFFAVAAVLVEHRLHNTRDAAQPGQSASGANSERDVRVDADEHLRFLCAYHEVLAASLLNGAAADGAAAAHDASVELAATHVARVLNGASGGAAPQLNLLLRLKRAVQDAEAASASSLAHAQRSIIQATQLAEQYAWLVQLDWYLWSPHFSPAAGGCGGTAALKESHGFADVWRNAAAARRWVEQVDPWALAPERCPDVCHLRYSNGLRRWDDKHYICFGAM